jgi:ubiquinone/menaquinone biosynthesis C-methylase UbiE
MNSWHKKRRVMQRYDLTAEIYEMRYGDEQTAKIEAALKHLKIEQHEQVLDAGCGTGILLDHIADEVKMIVGVDISKKTLFQARQRIHDNELSNAYLVQADVDNIPFSNNLFNKVFVLTVLQNSPDPAKTLTEIKRVGKTGTFFVVTGLKRIFSKRAFTRLLSNARLKAVAFEEKDLKCYVAVCTDRSPVRTRV